jgi:integrase
VTRYPLRRAYKKAGIEPVGWHDLRPAAHVREPPDHEGGIEPVGWHDLRHTFASHLTMRGQPLEAVQELFGHATIEMTMRYAHLSPDVKQDAAWALDAQPPAGGAGHELGHHGGTARGPELNSAP